MARKKNVPRIDLNPSSADRWTTCTASPKYIFDNWDKIPKNTDTTYNQEGTTAHEVAAAMLEGREPRVADTYLCPVPVTPEMRQHAWDYMEYVQELCEPESTLLVERKLPLWYMEGRNAMVDAAIINPNSLHVVDYKYGAGIVVSPEQNPQAIIYAFSVLHNQKSYNRDFPVTIHIYQPRGRAAEDSPIHKWETTTTEIRELAKGIADSAYNITLDSLFDTSVLTFAPSDKACQWCPAKGFCTERPRMLLEGIEPLVGEDIALAVRQLPAMPAITMDRLAAIVRHGDQVTKWIDDAQAYALDYMKGGGKLPGFKLVTSRGGHRYWRDPKRAAKVLLEDTHLRREEVITEDVISPAGVEKLLGKGGIPKAAYNLIDKPMGKPVIAPDSDKRESCMIVGSDEFYNLDSF